MSADEADGAVRYEPDDRCPERVSISVALQGVLLVVAPTVVLASFAAQASDQDDSYVSWAVFAALLVSGVLTALQASRVGRFGAGLVFIVSASPSYVAISILALSEGGPTMLSSLTAAAAISYVLLSFWLPKLRKIITPLVSGTVLMLIAVTLLPVCFNGIRNVPEGTPAAGGPIVGLVTLIAATALALRSRGAWRIWAPLITIGAGCGVALLFGMYDAGVIVEAPWIGLPGAGFPDFEPNFGASFWSLLPVFALFALVDGIKNIGDNVLVQQQSWRTRRVTDFRRVQGSINVTGAGLVLAGAVGSPPLCSYGTYSAALTSFTQVAARRVGVYIGAGLVAVALLPKLSAVLLAIPGPVAGSYLLSIVGLLFVGGIRTALQGGLGARDAVILGVAFALGAGVEQDTLIADLLGDVWGPLANNGVMVGAFSAVVMVMLSNLTGGRDRRRLDATLSTACLPELNEFLSGLAARLRWNDVSTRRLRSAGEETLMSLVDLDETAPNGAVPRLIVIARPADAVVELEFMAVLDDENLEDRLAYLGEEAEAAPGSVDASAMTLRLLRHYTSSVQHQKYHGLDVVTVQVSGSR
ncbi:uracil-xanthine permease family protein [Candidatus Poriferisodalis sp.]|uniref:uracil-xanthine permease family protein n=1 Tax=Candidatus Poriferisodalis sp. TaxID=3101277 RepID=UPI003B51F7D1